jgi:hypothetical protein
MSFSCSFTISRSCDESSLVVYGTVDESADFEARQLSVREQHSQSKSHDTSANTCSQ